ncbi:TPA: hypothetical protein UOA92_000342 [Stenotrophomonas maltophilia]|nr:hypothetical protein [Stenotrophomonas maltophilia]
MDAIERRARELLAAAYKETEYPPMVYESKGLINVRLDRREEAAVQAIIAALTPQWQPIETLDSDEIVITWHDFGTVNQNTASPHFGKTGYPRMQQRFGGRLFPSEACETGFVTHWQPLPAPPEVKP